MERSISPNPGAKNTGVTQRGCEEKKSLMPVGIPAKTKAHSAECVSVLNKEIDLTYWDETESRYWWVAFQTNGSPKLLGAGVSTPNRIDKPRPTIMA